MNKLPFGITRVTYKLLVFDLFYCDGEPSFSGSKRLFWRVFYLKDAREKFREKYDHHKKTWDRIILK